MSSLADRKSVCDVLSEYFQEMNELFYGGLICEAWQKLLGNLSSDRARNQEH